MSERPRARVFSIPASAPFLPTLIHAVLSGELVPGPRSAGDPLRLADTTIYLPTRRACAQARAAFVEHGALRGAILPRIVALGEVDEDEFAFLEPGTGTAGSAVLNLPPALDNFERRLLLARLVREWAGASAVQGHQGTPLVASTPTAALALADELARLMDDMTTRKVEWSRLDAIVPDHLDVYWQLALQFLSIAREKWPALLAERGAIEPSERRNRLLAAEAERLAGTSRGPVIAAGSTGSMPATAALLATIARLPNGAVVLPGLDVALDEDSWRLIPGRNAAADGEESPGVAGHPQYAMQALLSGLELAREDVGVLGRPIHAERERIVSEALRPAESTDRWSSERTRVDQARAAEGLVVVDAAGPEEEALAIAVALREVLEQPGARAALVTPDRALARRVQSHLARWNVHVPDSAGAPASRTPPGVLARLAAQVPLRGVEPAPLLALLKHPLCKLLPAPQQSGATSTLERAILRGPRPRPGIAGLAHALQAFRSSVQSLHRSDPRRSLTEPALDGAATLIERLTVALAPLEAAASSRVSLPLLASLHQDVVDALTGAEWPGGEDGTALANAFDALIERGQVADFALLPGDYPDLFEAVLSGVVIRTASAEGARLQILGPLEARLQSFDCVVLGGLVEGVWPPQPRSDPWLSRPMRQSLGLDLPERRIGLSAHDFAQMLGQERVLLTRSAKVGGAPTVASRFVQRLAAVLGKEHWSMAVRRGERYLSWARSLDRSASARGVQQPLPRPPRAARPQQLSVTEIETWLQDPYSIYAKRVLNLQPLDPVDTPPGARDRGTIVHGAVGEFTERFAVALPEHPLAELLAIGRTHFARLEDYPELLAFWWPRFARVAQWFAGWEEGRRSEVQEIFAEIRGQLEIPLSTGSFRLTAIADRIDRMADGSFSILDYKTGQIPREKEVRSGASPQLTLEGAILRRGGFRGIPAGASVSALAYVGLKGGQPPGAVSPMFEKDDPTAEADAAFERLAALVQRFDDPAQPYAALIRTGPKARYAPYDHLSRVKEWSATGGTDLEGTEP